MKVIEMMVSGGVTQSACKYRLTTDGDAQDQRELGLSDGRKAVSIIDIPDGYRLATDEDRKARKPVDAKLHTIEGWGKSYGNKWEDEIVYIVPFEPPKKWWFDPSQAEDEIVYIVPFEPPKKWWFDPSQAEDEIVMFCSKKPDANYIEVPERFAEYVKNKPEGEWELRKVRKDDIYKSILSGTTLTANGDTKAEPVETCNEFRWCRPRKPKTVRVIRIDREHGVDIPYADAERLGLV